MFVNPENIMNSVKNTRLLTQMRQRLSLPQVPLEETFSQYVGGTVFLCVCVSVCAFFAGGF